MSSYDPADSAHWPLVQGVRVDINALRALSHTCDPRLCRHTRCCCKSYEVLVDRGETRRIVGLMPEAAKYARGLRDGDSFHDPFDSTEDGLCLATSSRGRCVFAFNTPGGLRCSLHAAALKLNLPPASVKPKACALWPLFFDETDPPTLSVQEDAFSFPCNRTSHAQSLSDGVREILEDVFGTRFADEVTELLATPQ